MPAFPVSESRHGYTIDITKDDRGRIGAEVWHEASGKTVAITEVDTIADGRHWGRKVIEMQLARDQAQAELNADPGPQHRHDPE